MLVLPALNACELPSMFFRAHWIGIGGNLLTDQDIGLPSHRIILRPQREPGQQPFQRTKHRQELREEYSVYDPRRGKPGGAEEPAHLAAADKPSIFVIGTIVDGADGERVPGIVLEDKTEAIALQDASHLRNKDRQFRMIDVVKNARRKHQIERLIIERQSVAVQLDILGGVGKPRLGDIQALP